MTVSLEKVPRPHHEAALDLTEAIDNLSDRHDFLSGDLELISATERVAQAKEYLEKIEQTVGPDVLDRTVAEYMDDVHGIDSENADVEQMAIDVGVKEVSTNPNESPFTARALDAVPLDELGDSLHTLELSEGDAAVERVIEAIEAATGIPEYDLLDDYSPEFAGQILLHRSNAELQAGDIVLPSDQISEEQHHQLNAKRGFTSSSSPHGSSGSSGHYDARLAHAGTRDFGKTYGEYLYEVEPIEGDTPKWGENPGADIDRTRKVESAAFNGAELATTDSYSGKWHNEVVSTVGFKVVKRLPHEPTYDETMLPWPVSADAMKKHKDRYDNGFSNVAVPSTDTTPGSGRNLPVQVTSRKRPGKVGFIDAPGTYRAGAGDLNPAEWQTKFDVRKQHAEHPGQDALPGLSVSKYGAPDRWKAVDVEPPEMPVAQKDTPLPGMDEIAPRRPMF